MSGNIATLGFNFDSKSTTTKLSTLIEKFEKLEEKGSSTKKALQEVFSAIVPEIANSNERIGEFAVALKRVEISSKRISKSIGSVNKSLNQLNLKALNPLPANAAQNLERNAEKLITSLNKVGVRIQESIQAINIKPINPVSREALERVERMARLLKEIKPVEILKKDELDKLNRLEKGLAKLQQTRVPTPNIGKGGKAVSATKSLNDELSAISIRADAGTVALNGLTNSLTGMYFVNAIRNASELAQELAMIKSIASEFNTGAVLKGLQNLPSTLGRTADNARAFYDAYSSGIQGSEEDLVKFTEINAKLAKTIRADVTSTMDAVTTTMNAYGLSVKDASYVSDIFFSIVKYGKANGQQLATGLGQVVSTAKTAGLGLHELGASITVLSKIMQSRNAITYLNNMLAKMINPTKQVIAATQKYGIELGLSAVKAKGFNNVLREIYELSKKDQGILLEFFGDARGQRAALQLLGEGYGDLQRQIYNFQNSAGEMERAYNLIQGDVHVQLAALPNTFQRITESAGLAAGELLTFGGALQPLLMGVNSMNNETVKLVGTLSLGAAAYAGYKAVMLTIISLKSMMATNERILAGQRAEQNSITQALIDSDERYANILQTKSLKATLDNATAAEKRLKKAHQEVIERENAIVAIEKENTARREELMLSSSMEDAFDAYSTGFKLVIEQRKQHKQAIEEEIQAKKDSQLLDLVKPQTFSNAAVGASNAKMAMEEAKANFLNASAKRESAIASGDLASANIFAKQASQQWQIALKMEKIHLTAVQRQQKVNNLNFKALLVTTKKGTLLNKLHALSLKTGALTLGAWSRGATAAKIATEKLGVAIKSLLATMWPMLLISAAIEGLMWAFEKLDFSGAKAAEAMRDETAKMSEHFDKMQSDSQNAIENIKEENKQMQETSKTLEAIAGMGSLSNDEFAIAADMAQQVNSYLGEQGVIIDKNNNKISVSGNLQAKIARMQENALKTQLRMNVENLRLELERAKIQKQKAKEAVDSEWFWIGSAELEAERAAIDYYGSVLKAYGEAKKKLEEQNVATHNTEIKKLQTVLELMKEIRDLQSGYDYEDMSTEEKLASTLQKLGKSQKFMNPWKKYKEEQAAFNDSSEYKQYKKELEEYQKALALAKVKALEEHEKNKPVAPSEQLKKISMDRGIDNYNKQIEDYRNYVKNYENLLKDWIKKKEKLESEAPRALKKPVLQIAKPLSPEEQANAMKKLSKKVPAMAYNEEQYYQELKNYTKLNRERIKLERQLQKERQKLQKELEDNAVSWEKKRFENSIKFAKDDAERIKLIKKEQKKFPATQKGWQKAIANNPQQAMKDFEYYYSLTERRYEIQNQSEKALAEAAKRANSEMIKLVQSMDKFKAFTVQGVSANSTEALKLQSRSFATLPKIEAQKTSMYQSNIDQRNAELQKMTNVWIKNMNETLKNTADTWKNTDKMLSQITAKFVEDKESKEIVDSVSKVEKVLKEGIKVSVTNQLFEVKGIS